MRVTQAILATALFAASASAKVRLNCNDNVVIYWGQDSSGVQNVGQLEGPLRQYCTDSTADVINVAFVNGVNADGSIGSTNFANHDPSTIGADVTYCQQQGKTVMISVGGYNSPVFLTSPSQATAFADALWNGFLGGNGNRILGSAKFDGVDLDIEGGDGAVYYDVVANRLHGYGAYVSAAPECPSSNRMAKALPTGWFDWINVQFYNNDCQLSNYPGSFDYGSVWDTYAKSVSTNPNVKIMIGGPANPADGPNGYVDLQQFTNIFTSTRSQYPSSLGGVMLWEASIAFQQLSNNIYAPNLASNIRSGSSCGTPVPTSSPSQPSTTPTPPPSSTSQSSSSPTSTPSGSCPASGGACQAGTYACNGNNIAQCSNGQWYMLPCASGTTCVSSSSTNAYCDWGNNAPCGAAAVKNGVSLHGSNSTKLHYLPAYPKVPGPVVSEVLDFSNNAKSGFEYLVKIYAAKSNIPKYWTASFSVKSGYKVTNVTRGFFTQKGNKVTITSIPIFEQNLISAILINVKGTTPKGTQVPKNVIKKSPVTNFSFVQH